MSGSERTATDREKESTLAEEIEHFKREKERVRSIVGRIGAVPTFGKKIFNFAFIIAVAACFIASIVTHGRLTLSMIEIGITLISIKIIYLLHSYSRQMHFMFWILSSLEWRLNEIVRAMEGKSNESD